MSKFNVITKGNRAIRALPFRNPYIRKGNRAYHIYICPLPFMGWHPLVTTIVDYYNLATTPKKMDFSLKLTKRRCNIKVEKQL